MTGRAALALSSPRRDRPVLALAALSLPDCCLTGRHAVGFGMEIFAPICSAAR